MDPKMPLYLVHWPHEVTRNMVLIGLVGLLITLAAVRHAWKAREPVWLVVLAGLWAVIPLIWFQYEYAALYRVWGNPGTFELFKYGQDLA